MFFGIGIIFAQTYLQFMSKFFTLLLMVSGLGTAAFSQTKGTTQFGIEVGLNAATVTTGNFSNSDYRTGFNAGGSVEHYFSESWSFKAKVLYDQKGWDNGYLNNLTTGSSTNVDYHLNYITVPLLANWHFGHTKNWYLNFGPYVSFLLDAKAANTDLKGAFNSVDAGLDLGIGIKFPIVEKTNFFIEFNGQAGIPDMIKNNGNSSFRSSVSAINVGLTF
jgi:hypothetical protein